MDSIRDDGLGIRRVFSLALPTFLASAAGSLPLQDIILLNVALQPDSYRFILFSLVSYVWKSTTGPTSVRQSFWDRPGILANKAMVESSLPTEHEKASFLASSGHHSEDGFWHCLSLPLDSA